MSITNRGQLQSEISEYMHRTDLGNAQLDNFIDAAGYRLGTQLRTQFNEGRQVLAILPTRPGEYQLPDDWVETRAVYIDGSGSAGPCLLQLLAESETARYRASGSPVGYTLASDTELVGQPAAEYIIRTIPGNEENITLDYYQHCVIDDQPGSAGSHPVLIRYPYLYLYACLIEAHTWAQDFPMRDQVLTLYAAELDSANDAAMKARLVPGARTSTVSAGLVSNAPSRVM